MSPAKSRARRAEIGEHPGVRRIFLGSWIIAAACGPSPGGSASDGSTGTASASTGVSPTTGGTGEGSSSTGGTGTGSPATSTGVVTTGVVTTGSVGTSTGAGTTGDTTTGAPGMACVGDGDCKLHSDCCTCEGVHDFEDHPDCAKECPVLPCEAAGIHAAICRFGVCITERLSCDATKVTCKAAQPDCPQGQIPETTPDCWTGECVPAEHCDRVPDCALCPGDWMCVQDVAFGPQGWPRCEPVPAACGGAVDCDCVGPEVCVEPFTFCAAQGNHVDCECVNC